MARTVREVLGSVFAPQLRDHVFFDALRRASLSTVPEEAERARDFVEGPLRTAVLDLAGHDAAAAVLEGLEPMLEMAGSHVRARGDTTDVNAQALSTLPPAASHGAVPVVLLATLDRSGVRGIARSLLDVGEVRQIGDVFELVSAMDASRSGPPPILVIDCCLPAVDPHTVATMLPVLPEGAHVFLWGASEQLRTDIEAIQPAAASWLSCGAAATHEDLAGLVRALL